ncbi:hypothetical protein GE21DRAFT_1274348 [Neurospora crassa]|nr:hypothetical protein GE21DRAFT_1274348 [Neurospora crassa]
MGRKTTPHVVQASCVYKWWRLPPCFWKFSSSSSGGTSRELHQYHKDATSYITTIVAAEYEGKDFIFHTISDFRLSLTRPVTINRQYPMPPPPRHIPHWYLFGDIRFPLHSQSRNFYSSRDPQRYLSARLLAELHRPLCTKTFFIGPKHNPHEQARHFSENNSSATYQVRADSVHFKKDQGNIPGKSSQPKITADSF